MTDNVWKVNSPKCNTTAAAEPSALKLLKLSHMNSALFNNQN